MRITIQSYGEQGWLSQSFTMLATGSCARSRLVTTFRSSFPGSFPIKGAKIEFRSEQRSNDKKMGT